MPRYILYLPVKNPTLEFAFAQFTGPLDNYLNNVTAATSSSETPESELNLPSFRWTSGGTSELPYTLSSTPTYETLLALPAPNVPTSNRAQLAVQYALSKVGKPYVWGAKGNNDTFDCSGLIYAAFKSAGVNVPGSTAAWKSSNKLTVNRNEGQAGDVIITNSNGPSGGHARLITRNLGNGKYECVEAKGKKYGVVTSTYTVDKNLVNIYRAKKGAKLTKKLKV